MAVRGGHMECGTSSLISRRTNRLRCATHSILARVTAVAMRDTRHYISNHDAGPSRFYRNIVLPEYFRSDTRGLVLSSDMSVSESL